MDVSTETPRRRSNDSSSPEFEFWMLGNPSFPQPQLLTADELFADGVLLPLQLLSLPQAGEPISKAPAEPEPEREPDPEPDPAPDPAPPPEPANPACISASPSSGSKRWKDIFKVGERKAEEKEKRKERKGSAGGAAEFNINIWPFSRSRSAGNGAAAGRPSAAMAAAAGRKACSAPCSRSNSRGESSVGAGGRRWAASPGRAGVPVGRTSPVWQIRRGGNRLEPPSPARPNRAAGPRDRFTSGGGRKGSGVAGGGGGARVLNLSVNTCIGYRSSQVTCRGDDKARANEGDRTAGFSLKTIFSKKVY